MKTLGVGMLEARRICFPKPAWPIHDREAPAGRHGTAFDPAGKSGPDAGSGSAYAGG